MTAVPLAGAPAAVDPTGWSACLDRFEACLAAQRTQLEQGHPERIVAFVAEVHGPLPAVVAPRARDLQAQAVALEAALRTAAAQVNRQLRLTQALADGGPRSSTYVSGLA